MSMFELPGFQIHWHTCLRLGLGLVMPVQHSSHPPHHLDAEEFYPSCIAISFITQRSVRNAQERGPQVVTDHWHHSFTKFPDRRRGKPRHRRPRQYGQAAAIGPESPGPAFRSQPRPDAAHPPAYRVRQLLLDPNTQFHASDLEQQ
ncbi:hypothetical protein V2G26_003004 [Clonostachys chloroleuca]